MPALCGDLGERFFLRREMTLRYRWIARLGGSRLFVGFQPTLPSSERTLASVLFTDIVSLTATLSEQGDEGWRHILNTHDAIIDRLMSSFGGHKVKDTGDGVVLSSTDRQKRRAVRLASSPALAARGIPIRAGVRTGECERRGDDWSGLAVHIGARVAAMAGAGEVVASRTVRDLSAGSGLTFEDPGSHSLKDVPDEWEISRVR